ncbi:chemotaxis protein CheW [Acuticoccus mangrovi]|uniref:Purine-binding chemotaxis protein CheW n=1 Tax=Acuticoccus mangrovi TaxID=2796142 RepID=A0A934IRA1_9HYPH|nr:purine-binding chemotaxis protein CheW [Acuticoccus mangrovi]
MSALARTSIADGADGFVTAKLAGHWFALPISAVDEVFLLTRITDVPRSPPGIIGVLNLRGRIVTALDTRQILGFPPAKSQPTMAIGIERAGELFGLAVDEMGDVLTSVPSEREPAPMNLDRRWRDIVIGVQRSDNNLVLIVAVDRLFDGVISLVGT